MEKVLEYGGRTKEGKRGEKRKVKKENIIGRKWENNWSGEISN